MKTFILPLVCFLSFMSCDEENPEMGVDPFVGSWHMANADLGLQVDFDVTQTSDGLSFDNAQVVYPEITDQLDCRIETYGRFAVNPGYEEIKITNPAITLNMIRSIVHLKTPDQMDVYRLEIIMPDREPVVLQEQVFTRNNP